MQVVTTQTQLVIDRGLKMNRGNVITVIVVILIASIFGYFYYTHEKPVQEEILNNFDANIYAVDSITGDMMVTNYSIYLGGVYYESDMTLKGGPIVKRYEAGSSVMVKSENIEYYNDEVFANPDILNLSRVELRLVMPSELKIEQDGEFLFDKEITFNLSTKHEYRNPIVCAEWSRNFVYVKANYPKTTTKPKEFDKCWETNEILNSTSIIPFVIDYKEWDFITSDDFIRLYFMDSENGISDYNLTNDKWAEDINVTLNINNI